MNEKQALIVFCRELFGMHNITGADIEDVKVEYVDRSFVLGAGGGLRIQFAVSNDMLGKAMNEDLSNAMRVLKPDLLDTEQMEGRANSKKFFIYYSSDSDRTVVQGMHNQAVAHAREIGKTVAVVDVDVDTATGDARHCYGEAGTIECVTAEDAVCKERVMNPSRVQINGMVDRV